MKRIKVCERINVSCVVIPVVIVLGILFAIIIPALENSVVQTAVVDTFKQKYGSGGNLYVSVDSNELSFLTGDIKQVYIEYPDSEFNGIKAQSLTIRAKDVRFDLRTFLLGRRVKIKKVGKISSQIILNEDGINQYISNKCQDISGLRVSLRSNKITGTAGVDMIGAMEIIFKPRLKGDYVALDPVDAKFAQINKMGLDDAKYWVKEIPLDLPVSNLPFGLKVCKILVQNRQMMVTAEN